ncbi:MAG: nucleotidyltransferase family protein [Myxococcota bacterium]
MSPERSAIGPPASQSTSPVHGPLGPRRAIVLAGRRPGPDALAEGDGAPHRALLDIEGEPMLVRVLRRLLAWPTIEHVLVNIDRPELLDAVADLAPWREAGRVSILASTASPSRSVLESLDRLDLAAGPILVTTADHALLDEGMLSRFFEAGEQTGADLCVALVPRSVIAARFPEARRTYLHFRGESFSGANLFLFRTPAARNAALFWQRVEGLRKRPWRIARAFGWRNLVSFLLRRISLQAAFERVSHVLGLRAEAIALPQAEAAVDVDKLDDLVLVRRLLAERRHRSVEPAAPAVG